MASSNSHKFGQIIGDALEMAVEPFLRYFATEHNLYLDVKGPRAARPGSKVTWIDINGNKHDLDFVLEKYGSESLIGSPVAFIECAWRRYTKHSKNKAQEIQGAIIPLFDKYKSDHPFTGVILAGEFTDNSLVQLKSLGFS
nr:DNA methylase [Spirochaetota bacterium]